jgi:hypothetical protein
MTRNATLFYPCSFVSIRGEIAFPEKKKIKKSQNEVNPTSENYLARRPI